MLRSLAPVLLILSALIAPAAVAADACPSLRGQGGAADAATRIAAAACSENLQWFRPFIDTEGRLASASVYEAETARLQDGVTETWRRTASYWRDTGLLQRMNGFAGAEQCFDPYGSAYANLACRAFLVDNPWSAAFVSYILMKAGVPGFRPSASHYDYVREAYRNAEQSPFQYLDPASARPATGDLLCAVRSGNRVYGYAGLTAALDGTGGGSLGMHCDIVVAVNPGNDGKAYLIGGNVQQGATLRMMAVNRNGQFWPLPLRSETQVECSPDTAKACDMNKMDWAVLLKLKPEASLAQLAPPLPLFVPQQAPPPQPQGCCVQCVVGSGVPRCPNPNVPPPQN